jgi:predicted nucleic acid-binding protein
MGTYLLNTNHASALLDPDHPLSERVKAALAGGHTVLVPLDVVEEIQFGVAAIRDPVPRARRREQLGAFLSWIAPTALTLDGALEGGLIRGRLRRSGCQLQAVDGHLAAIAKLNGLTLVTDDGDFAPLSEEIAVENWLR